MCFMFHRWSGVACPSTVPNAVVQASVPRCSFGVRRTTRTHSRDRRSDRGRRSTRRIRGSPALLPVMVHESEGCQSWRASRARVVHGPHRAQEVGRKPSPNGPRENARTGVASPSHRSLSRAHDSATCEPSEPSTPTIAVRDRSGSWWITTPPWGPSCGLDRGQSHSRQAIRRNSRRARGRKRAMQGRSALVHPSLRGSNESMNEHQQDTLSARERRALRVIEDGLRRDDPLFVDEFEDGPSPRSRWDRLVVQEPEGDEGWRRRPSPHRPAWPTAIDWDRAPTVLTVGRRRRRIRRCGACRRMVRRTRAHASGGAPCCAYVAGPGRCDRHRCSDGHRLRTRSRLRGDGRSRR